MRSLVFRRLPLAAACVLFSTGVFAQVTTATLQGVVQDQSGSRLPGAAVSVRHDDTAAVRTMTTNPLGEFTVTALPRGAYTVTIELQGFKTHTSTGLDLPGGQTVRQTFDLEIGSIGESVTVQGETPLVEASTSHQMETLGALKLSELPLARRNITGLLRLAPGADTTGGTRGVRLNGVGRHGTGISVDGTDANSNPEGRGLSQYQGTNYIDVMSIEAVQEVQLVKGIMPAEYGGVVGGQINVISRSGTNVFHGSLVENYQGQALNARDLFLPSRTADGQAIPKPRVVFNQFGASLGGPILRNKVFFFGTYEGYRESAFQRVQGTVPTQALRDQLLAALPFPETRMALDTIPLPTEPRDQDVGLFVGARNRERTENHVVAKSDLVMGGGAHLTLTYTRMRPFALDPRINLDGINDRTWTSEQDRVAVNYVMTRGTTVYESRFGYNRNDMARLDRYFEIRDPGQPETNLWGRRLGQLSIRSLFSTPGSEVWDMDGTAYNADQKVSRTFGRHQVKIGGRWTLQTGMRSNPENPVFVFQNKADALANIPSEVRPTFGAPPHTSRMHEVGGFAQDDWRLSNRFVLNLGVRYDYYTPILVEPTTDAPATIVNFGTPTDLRRLDFGPQRPADQPYKPDGWVNLGPRAGFALTLDDDGSSVVRGGFGVFYSPHMPGMVRQGVADPLVPFRVSWTTAAAADRGLRWPMYNDDMRVIVEKEASASGRPFFFSIIDENLQ
nr:TonB-dependent receptor [Acidobacteriota bacterium]